jgi:hypothetical protein
MMSNAIESFVDRRVELLSSVFLTSRPDVEVSSIEFGGDVTQIARIITADDRNERIFGIISKGSVGSLKSAAEAGKFLNKGRSRNQIRQFPFPVLVLAFSMVGDEGYYAWQAEPSVSENGVPVLLVHTKLDCRRADRKALDLIVEQVFAWHDHFYKGVFRMD